MSDVLLKTAEELRSTIEAAQAAGVDLPWLGRFPNKGCNFASNLLLLKFADAGISPLRRMIGTVTDERGDDIANHVWVVADGHIVDITADVYGQPKVIVSETSAWHDLSLIHI